MFENVQINENLSLTERSSVTAKNAMSSHFCTKRPLEKGLATYIEH